MIDITLHENSARLLKGHRFKDTAVDLGLEISGR
jgi:hypothetical protein